MRRPVAELVSGYADPILFSLTQRGFYSEVNNLLNAVLYALVRKRRLIVDQVRFAGGGIHWSDLFTASLPGPPEHEVEVRPEWVIPCANSRGFHRIRRTARRWHNYRAFFLSPRFGLFRSVLHAKRCLAAELCRPRADLFDGISRPPEIDAGPYAAVHIRRGDKVDGFVNQHNVVVVEGDDTPVSEYVRLLRQHARGLTRVFAMSDDVAAIAELRALAPDLQVFTLCQQDEHGYQHTEFNAQTADARMRDLRRVIAEVELAAGSEVFIGCFRSNLSRYVPLVHRYPRRCFSADSHKQWYPM